MILYNIETIVTFRYKVAKFKTAAKLITSQNNDFKTTYHEK